MDVKKAMTLNPTFCKPETTLREIAKTMKSLDSGIIPIGDGERLLGMITDRDITLSLANNADPDKTLAREFMHASIYYCYEDASIDSAAASMGKLQVRRLIVLNNKESKKMVGVISMGDIARFTHDKITSGDIVNKVSEERCEQRH